MNPQNEWEKRLGQRLRNLSEEPPAGGWERLERDLAARSRRPVPWHNVMRAAVPLAAAAALLLVLLLPSPETPSAQRPAAGSPDGGSTAALARVAPPAADAASAPDATHATPPAAESRLTAAGRLENSSGRRHSSQAPQLPDNAAEDTKETAPAGGAEHPTKEETHPGTSPVPPVSQPGHGAATSGQKRWKTPDEGRHRRLQLAFAVQGAPGSSLGSGGYLSPPRSLLAAESGSAGSGGGSQHAVSNFLAANLGQEVASNVKHRVPVQASLLIGVPLSGRLSLETGLSYTFLSSEISGGSPTAYYTTRQHLHYVGIPLGLRYDFLQTGRFRFYVAAGAQADCCVDGSQATRYLVDGQTAGPEERCSAGHGLWQGSAYLRGGVQADLTRRLGIYLEPGAAYYFPDGSDLLTPHSHHPFHFSWQAGVRLTLPR